MKRQLPEHFAAYLGIDWADAKHDICLQAADSPKPERSVLRHWPEASEAWAQGLQQRFHGQPLAVCLELPKGPLVSALQNYDFFILFPGNPATLAKYRQAFPPSRAKDDPTDAELQLDLLRRHRDKLQPLLPQSPAMRALQQLVEARRRQVGDKVRITKRLTSVLKNYFPQVLEGFKDKDTRVFCDFLSRWPTLKQAQQARKATLEAFFHDPNVRYPQVIADRIQALKQTRPLTDDIGVILPNKLLAQVLVDQLRVVLQAIERFDTEITAVAQPLPDYALVRSLPGVGPALAPRLLAAFGEQRERYPSAADLQKYAGIAPVTERSGQKSWVHWRLQCPTFLRQTFVEWAAESIPRSFWAGLYSQQPRQKGCSHNAALRALAFKWIRILHRCWQPQTPSNEATYLQALKHHGSPLLSQLAKTP